MAKEKRKKVQRRSAAEIAAEVKQFGDGLLKSAREYTRSPEDVQQLLGFMAKFPTYSVRNQMLIRDQYQGASAVASFSKLKSMGVSVKKGEHGLRIFAPRMGKVIVDEQGHEITFSQASESQKNQAKAGKIKTRERRLGYHMVSVFDVTQTNMAPADYPRLYPNRPISFESDPELTGALNEALDKYSASRNVQIKELDGRVDGAAQGEHRFFSDGHADILIDGTLPDVQKVAVKIHEIGHSLMHVGPRAKDIPTDVAELQAEMVSGIVAEHYGIDTSEMAVPYIADWTRNLQTLDDKSFNEQMQVLNAANATAREIIQAVDPAMRAVLDQRTTTTAKEEAETKSSVHLTDEQINHAMAVDIIDFAKTKGIDLVPDGIGRFRGVEHDSLVVDQRKNSWHWNAQSQHGNVIQFAETFVIDDELSKGEKFQQAVRMLNDSDFELHKEVKIVHPDFKMTKARDFDVSKPFMQSDAFHYLTEERGINAGILYYLNEKEGLLGNDKDGNVLYKFIDPETGSTVGGFEQGTVIDYEKFGKRGTLKKVLFASKEGYGFQYSYGEPKNLHFFESEIDMLSYLSLNDRHPDSRYISMNGLIEDTVLTQWAVAVRQLGKSPESLVLNVDNDEAGAKFVHLMQSKWELRDVEHHIDGNNVTVETQEFEDGTPDPSVGKDWNDALKTAKKHQEILLQGYIDRVSKLTSEQQELLTDLVDWKTGNLIDVGNYWYEHRRASVGTAAATEVESLYKDFAKTGYSFRGDTYDRNFDGTKEQIWDMYEATHHAIDEVQKRSLSASKNDGFKKTDQHDLVTSVGAAPTRRNRRQRGLEL